MEFKLLSRREKIILTAIDIINDLGFQGLSTREIARREEMAESTLYRHFKNKDEVISGVLDFYSGFDPNLFNTIASGSFKPVEGILFFIKTLAEYFENYPALTAVMLSYGTLMHETSLRNKIKEILDNRSAFLSQLVKSGQEQGEIIADIAYDEISDIIYGNFRIIVLKWRLENYKFSLKDRVVSSTEDIIRLIKL